MFEIVYKVDGKIKRETHPKQDTALAATLSIMGLGFSNAKEVNTILRSLLDTGEYSTYIKPKFFKEVPSNMPLPRLSPISVRKVGKIPVACAA